MKIDVVIPYPYAVVERCRRESGSLPRNLSTVFGTYVFFQHGKQSLDTSCFANIGILCQSVVRTHYILTQSYARPTLAPIGTRSLGLQPVQQRKTLLLSSVHMFVEHLFAYVYNITQYIIVLRPVNNGYISFVEARNKILTVYNLAVVP